jgi:hypothetical protein
MQVVQYLSAHAGNVGTVEGNVRAAYNNRVLETKANQGGITSGQRDALKLEARVGSAAQSHLSIRTEGMQVLSYKNLARGECVREIVVREGILNPC